jgi:signal transduction histidine kinase/ActR/RegA family two-component response regulator
MPMCDAPTGPDPLGFRVLMLAPTARDGTMAKSVLAHAGIEAAVLYGYEEMATALEKGAGAIIVMEEFFSSRYVGHLLEILKRQPTWSSLSLIVLSSGKYPVPKAGPAIDSLANVVLLERPVRIEPLVTAVRAALAARRRQYEIRDNIQEIKRAYDERDRLYNAAESARADAEASNRMKDEFLATLSHELRTPLNAIVGWSKVLRSGKADEHDMEEGLAAIERNSHVQAQLIEDLLDVSRIISGKLRLEVQRLHLSDVIDAALAAVMPAATAKGVRIHKVLDSLAGAVMGDAARLQQIIWNLLSNAVKFTPKGGMVQVLLERVNSHVEVSVVDTGMGIPPEFLPHVFDRFRQADSTTTRRYGGLGLGLAIVKQLAEMHGGAIRAKSPGEGRGATFTLMLPIAVVHPEQSENGRPRSRDVEPTVDYCQDGALKGLRVLVVDDEPDARQLIRLVLTKCEAEVAVASNVSEARELIESFQPHVILSDVGMPGEDGYDLIRDVRARHSAKELPAAALTAFARVEDRKRALRAGFQTHVSKPVDPEELTAVIASLAGRTGHRGEYSGGTRDGDHSGSHIDRR